MKPSKVWQWCTPKLLMIRQQGIQSESTIYFRMNVFTDNILLISLASVLCSTHKRPQQIILKAK